MITVSDLCHEFRIGKKGKERVVPVLHHINLHVERGEIVTVVGRSGSGKSTLLNLVSGYIRPTAGQLVIDGRNVTKLSEGEWADFRLEKFGFIFQSFQLIPSMTAFENVELPLVLKGMEVGERRRRTEAMLKRVGLDPYAGHYPGELSGGQQQRVSIARALIVNPPIILADEPTGSLDTENEQSLLDFIRELNREQGITFLIITHDEQVASIGHRKVVIQDGRLVDSLSLVKGGLR
ncbi:ABC transporter ATP-binding protein [Paenibacillus koleovorans]|uniref:ABC transporter ATP-binding protein n=1 Tax=Paenibacillus koleovorans TaxID=121608 RepID=UPI000FD96C3C|nr:ABC transporter ATP-binding protein [Paenibacillus koleovorans]